MSSIYTAQITIDPKEEGGPPPPVPEVQRRLEGVLADSAGDNAELNWRVTRVAVIDRS